MPKYYSKDMRVAALKCVERGERHEEIIKFFGISLKTLSNWVRLERQNDDLLPNKRSGYKSSKSLKNSILEAVELHPDFTLDDFSEIIPRHRTTIFYHLKKLGITHKKNSTLQGKKASGAYILPPNIA